MNDVKVRKGTQMETVPNLSKKEGLDEREFGADLVRTRIGAKVYGQTFANPEKAEQLKKRRIREARREQVESLTKPQTSLSKVRIINSGVLDCHIRRADIFLPKIEEELTRLEQQLKSDDLKGYQRARIEREISALKDRKSKHIENEELCEAQLDILHSHNSESSEFNGEE